MFVSVTEMQAGLKILRWHRKLKMKILYQDTHVFSPSPPPRSRLAPYAPPPRGSCRLEPQTLKHMTVDIPRSPAPVLTVHALNHVNIPSSGNQTFDAPPQYEREPIASPHLG